MVDITAKTSTLRIARATAIVKTSSMNTIEAIQNKQVPKGDVFEMSKAAGLLAVKKTPDLLPDCHPLPIESTKIEYEIIDLDIHIYINVKTIYKTGVEVEAMHGASVVALNCYDMLKPIDKGIEISTIKLLEKKGGKSSFNNKLRRPLTAKVFVCSDTIYAGQKEDKAGSAIEAVLRKHNVSLLEKEIVPDEKTNIESGLKRELERKTDLIIFTGGTGLSSRDITPDTLLPFIEKRILGIEEAIRSHGQERTPYSMLSRSLAGTIKQSLILALPGSTNGARESMEAVFPGALHIFQILKGARHD